MVNLIRVCKEKLLKDPKLLIIVLLALIIIVILILESNFKEVSLTIEDRCGKFVNLMSHTIEDGSVCKSRCRAQCQSIELTYKKVEFNKSDNGCNSCVCYCR